MRRGNILQQNTETLRDMALFNMADKRNALAMKNQEQAMTAREREEKAKRIWVMGKAWDKLKPGDEKGYQNILSLRKDLFGDQGTEEMPKSLAEAGPDFIERMKFRGNLAFDFLTKGKEEYIPKSEAEWADIEKAADIKSRMNSGKYSTQTTIYGPGGKTKRVSIDKREDYVPPEGWSLKKPDKSDKPRKPSAIKKDIVGLEKTRDEIITQGMTGQAAFAMIANVDPDLARDVKNADHNQLLNAIDDALQELVKELPAGSRPKIKRSERGSWKRFMPPK